MEVVAEMGLGLGEAVCGGVLYIITMDFAKLGGANMGEGLRCRVRLLYKYMIIRTGCS